MRQKQSRNKTNFEDLLSLLIEDVCVETRVIYLNGEVDQDMAALAIKGLHILETSSSSDPATILINSEGGSVVDGLAIYDAIQLAPFQVETRVVGVADSMAAWILQAGDIRSATRYSRIMVHQGTSAPGDDLRENLNAWAAHHQHLDKVCIDILYRRMVMVNPKITPKQVEKLIQFDKIYTAQQALDAGLIDQIIYPKG